VTLQRLRQRGSVRDRVTASGKGPAQRIYRRTPAGTKALRAWLAGDPLIGDERYSYVAQVYLMAELGGSQATLRFFTSLHKRLADRLKALHAIERGWAEVSPRYPDRLPADEFHQQLTVRLGLRTAVARLEWCGESIRRLRSWIRRMENDHDHDP
jgi:DNA-binding PadR family transcriptional regulator